MRPHEKVYHVHHLSSLVQTLLTEEDLNEILQELNYRDTATKFTANQLLLFFMHAALGRWDSYHSGVGKAVINGLIPVCYSTFSGKASAAMALFHGERAGIKLHVAFAADTEQPVQVIESIGSVHDGPIGEQLANKEYILVNDRAYGKIKRFDQT